METTTYIAFLRGINVGGRHIVKMERLRALFSALGFNNVRSYIQSGNLFFETTETDRAILRNRIEQHLLESLGFSVPVFLRTVGEIEALLQLEPFEHVEVTPETRLLIIFLSGPLPDGLTLPVQSPRGDFEILQAASGAVFAVLRVMNGRVGDPSAFIEKTFNVRTTARFFGTTIKILQAAKGGRMARPRPPPVGL